MGPKWTRRATISTLLALFGCQSMGEVARSGSAEEVRRAIEEGADLERRERSTGATPLLLAVAHNPQPVEVARLLLQAGASARAADRRGETALHLAMGRPGHALALAGLLLDAGADPNAARAGPDPLADSNTPLHLAAQRGDQLLDTVALLLGRGARPDAQNVREEGPLHLAAGAPGSAGVVRLLVAHGASPDAWSRNGSPLVWAARSGQSANVGLLLELGAKVNARGERGDELSALERAVQARQVEVARLLLEAGADPNVESVHYGFVPFRHRGEQPDALAWRMTHAPTPRFERMTPLHLAASTGDLEMVRALLDHGARTDVGSHFDGGPLDFAIYLEQFETAELLLSRGARAQLGDSHLILAAGAGNARQVELLLRGGADPDARSSYQNQTPLHCAAQAGAVAAAERLLAGGADPALVDSRGKKPSELAAGEPLRTLLERAEAAAAANGGAGGGAPR